MQPLVGHASMAGTTGALMSSFYTPAGFGLAIAWAGVACAAPATTPADWLRQPRSEDLLTVWPAEAWKRGMGGKATIACEISVQGALRACVVESESPSGAGFGAAAIALTPQLLMKPATSDGKPVVSAVRIPVNFPTPDVATGTRLPGVGGFSAMSRTSVSGVSWLTAPTYDDVAAAYPAKARAKQVGGRVTLNCSFKSKGRVGDCDVLAEEPKGEGFGSAAKSLVDQFVGPTELADGGSILGVLTQIPFTFSVEMLDADQRVIGKPQWRALPTGDQFLGGYPPEALTAGVHTAKVVMSCGVGAEGKVENCVTTSEQPAGLGFGAAAVAPSSAFQVTAWTAEGLPTIGGKIRVPIRYEVPETEAQP